MPYVFRAVLLIVCVSIHASAQESPPAPPAAEPPAAGAPVPPPLPQASPDEFTPQWEESVERGLRWLANAQNDDGSFGSRGTYNRHVGISALAGIAFLADGNLPDRGRYARQVANVLDFVLACSTESGLLIGPTVDHGPMYGHGFATLFLAEVYGQSRDPRVYEALRKAVRLLVATQNDEGGWRYQARPVDADVSVTICSVMALRAARNSGVAVPKQTIDRAIEYVLKCQEPDGGFRYVLNSSGSEFPRSAAGLCTLYYAGMYSGRPIDLAIRYLRPFNPGRPNTTRTPYHYFYGHYYAVQAMFQAGGSMWDEWWPGIRDDLIEKQRRDGSWEDSSIGPEYGTAMALIIQQVPKRLLPILQR